MRADTLASPEAAAQYYDKRHVRGWMDWWPDDKKRRVIELIQSAGIAPDARVLEYGCGVGVFAEALKQAAPDLDVHGCDISSVAITRAGQRCRNVAFHAAESSELEHLAGTFDLIYTHHVLEHVGDLESVLGHIGKLLKKNGRVLHVVPCANPNSLEYNICNLTEDGIEVSGRFCCDDSSHVRRLTSESLVENCRNVGFVLHDAWFANQFWGGVDYLTQEYHWTLLRWLNPIQGKSTAAKMKLLGMMLTLGSVCVLRGGPAYVFKTIRSPAVIGKRLAFAFAMPLAIALYPLSAALSVMISRLKEREWRRNGRAPNGSEMYCLFEKW